MSAGRPETNPPRFRFPWGLVRVSGNSMAPLLADGDFVLYRRVRGTGPVAPGSVIVANHAQFGMIIKTVDAVSPDLEYTVSGVSTLSTEARQLGRIRHDQVIGIVSLRIAPSGLSFVRNVPEPVTRAALPG